MDEEQLRSLTELLLDVSGCHERVDPAPAGCCDSSIGASRCDAALLKQRSFEQCAKAIARQQSGRLGTARSRTLGLLGALRSAYVRRSAGHLDARRCFAPDVRSAIVGGWLGAREHDFGDGRIEDPRQWRAFRASGTDAVGRCG
jgi:hypothetical protein